MIDKKTRQAVNVYGFVSYGLSDISAKAVTYQDDPLLKIRKFVDRYPDKKYDKVLVLVDARDLVPIE